MQQTDLLSEYSASTSDDNNQSLHAKENSYKDRPSDDDQENVNDGDDMSADDSDDEDLDDLKTIFSRLYGSLKSKQMNFGKQKQLGPRVISSQSETHHSSVTNLQEELARQNGQSQSVRFQACRQSTVRTGAARLVGRTRSELQAIIERYKREENGEDAGTSTEMLYRWLGRVTPRSREGQAVFGGVSGWMAGYLTMKIGKVAAYSIGAGLLALQFAHYKGYVQVDWGRISEDFSARGREFIRRTRAAELDDPSFADFLERNQAIAAGFAGGFLMGLASS